MLGEAEVVGRLRNFPNMDGKVVVDVPTLAVCVQPYQQWYSLKENLGEIAERRVWARTGFSERNDAILIRNGNLTRIEVFGCGLIFRPVYASLICKRQHTCYWGVLGLVDEGLLILRHVARQDFLLLSLVCGSYRERESWRPAFEFAGSDWGFVLVAQPLVASLNHPASKEVYGSHRV